MIDTSDVHNSVHNSMAARTGSQCVPDLKLNISNQINSCTLYINDSSSNFLTLYYCRGIIFVSEYLHSHRDQNRHMPSFFLLKPSINMISPLIH